MYSARVDGWLRCVMVNVGLSLVTASGELLKICYPNIAIAGNILCLLLPTLFFTLLTSQAVFIFFISLFLRFFAFLFHCFFVSLFFISSFLHFFIFSFFIFLFFYFLCFLFISFYFLFFYFLFF